MAPERREGVYSIRELSEEARKRVLDKWRYEIWDDHDSQYLSDEFKEILSQRGFNNPEVGWSLGYCQGDGVCFWGNLDPKDFFTWVFSGEKEAKSFKKLFKPFVRLQDHVGIIVRNEDRRYCHWNSMSVEVEFTSREEDFIPEEMRHTIWVWQNRQENLPRKGPKEWRPGTGMPKNIQDVIDKAKRDYELAEDGKFLNEFQDALGEWVKETSRELEKMGYAEIEYRQSDESIIEFLEGNDYEFDEDGEEL